MGFSIYTNKLSTEVYKIRYGNYINLRYLQVQQQLHTFKPLAAFPWKMQEESPVFTSCEVNCAYRNVRLKIWVCQEGRCKKNSIY